MNPNHASLPAWMFRLVHRTPQAAPTSVMSSRIEVRPPQLWASSLTWRGRLQRWLEASPWMPASQRPVNRLAQARVAFVHHLADVDGPEARVLGERIERARSLRELWHLRMAVYGAVARAISQIEADERLGLLNQHFPVRAPRSTLGQVDG